MTREQARREIDSLDFYLQNHTDDYGEESHTAMMMAKDALSCSEKPNKWISAEVLDKIRERVELEKLGYPPSAGYYRAIMKVLQIIDKYKAESEDKE